MQRYGKLINTLLLAAIVCLAVDALPAAQEHSTSTSPAFDVVSIKEGIGAPKFCKYLNDRMACQLSLLHLIKEAYQVEYFQLDSPKWMGDSKAVNQNDRIFLLEATMPAGTTKETARLMLRQALANRFGLKIHRETRIIPAYALIPGKHGVKLHLADDPDNPKRWSADTPMGKLMAFKSTGPGMYKASSITLDSLALDVTYGAELDRPVVNMTGLTGAYDIELHWDPTPGIIYGMKDPAFLATMRSQLGLELEKRNLPIEILVIDHAETTPSAN